MSSSVPSKFKKMVQGKSSVKDLMVSSLAEVLGTAILVFLGCLGCMGGFTGTPVVIQTTLNFGIAVLIVIQCFGHISHAHVNPSMTVGSMILGLKSIQEGACYIIAQCIGAVLGYGLLKAITPAGYLSAFKFPSDSESLHDPEYDNFCVTNLHPQVSALSGLLIEGISTAILMLIACAVWDKRNAHNTDSVAIKFGLSVCALATSVGPYTGCSMNPARSFGPALWNSNWDNHWVYWFGPIGGALLASLAYKTVFSPKDDEDEEMTIPENVALNSVDSHKPEMSRLLSDYSD
ncbi:aquaporin AQPAe.a-like isoform X2 [Phymastichus coffea]|uniref:aquaporin AQPAe.a-like isoform X2 n=1 Tax=Phymastichus coffea TaxID=108790 RepID=UPI00273CB01B|nr:aquaporin AQPAe.a-like isoform X2 [Phymastichus coffea]